MKRVSGAVDRLLRGFGIDVAVARVEAVDRWPAVAAAVFGADAGSTRAISVDGTTLVVGVPTSAWASEIRLREREIVRRLATVAPRSGITAIRTVPIAP